MPDPSPQRPHPVLLAGAIAVMVVSWTLNFIVVKVALRYFTPWMLAAFRVELSALILLPIYLVFGARARAAAGKKLFDRHDFWTFGCLAVLGVCLNQVCFTIGLNYTTVGHSALIIGTGPILILLLAWTQGLEALTAKKAAGMALAFAGVIVLAAEHGLSLHSSTLRGDLITLTGSVAFVVYTVVGKKVAPRYDTLSMNTYNFLFAAILILPLAVVQAARFERQGGWTIVPWQGWAALGFIAAFASVASYLIYFWVLRYMAASRLGAFSYVHPVTTTVMGIWLLGEKLTRSLLLGGGLVFLGIYLIESGREAINSELTD